MRLTPDLIAAAGEVEYLIRPLIVKGSITTIMAPAGIGKSILALQLAQEATMIGESVLYLDYEMGIATIADRLTKMRIDDETVTGPLWYEIAPTLQPLNSPQGWDSFREMTNQMRPRPTFVIIDSLARAVVGGENSADTYTEFEEWFLAKMRANGTTVLIVDHLSDKGDIAEARSGRGSSRKLDAVDTQWKMLKGGGQLNGVAPFRLRNTKDRLGLQNDKTWDYERTQDPLRYRLVTLSLDQLSQTELDCLVILELEGRSKLSEPLVQEIMEKHTGTGVRKGTALTAMKAYRQGLGTNMQGGSP